MSIPYNTTNSLPKDALQKRAQPCRFKFWILRTR